MNNPNQIIAIQFDKKKLFRELTKLSILLIPFVFLWVLLLIKMGSISVFLSITISIHFLIIMGMLYRYFNRRPALILDKEGLISNAVGFGIKIPWQSIQTVETKKVYGHDYLMIHTKNTDQIAENLSAWKRMVLKGNERKLGAPLVVSAKYLECPAEEVVNLILTQFSSGSAEALPFQTIGIC